MTPLHMQARRCEAALRADAWGEGEEKSYPRSLSHAHNQKIRCVRGSFRKRLKWQWTVFWRLRPR